MAESSSLVFAQLEQLVYLFLTLCTLLIQSCDVGNYLWCFSKCRFMTAPSSPNSTGSFPACSELGQAGILQVFAAIFSHFSSWGLAIPIRPTSRSKHFRLRSYLLAFINFSTNIRSSISLATSALKSSIVLPCFGNQCKTSP